MKFMFDEACHFKTKDSLLKREGLIACLRGEDNFTMRKNTENPLPGYLPSFCRNHTEAPPALPLRVFNCPVLPQQLLSLLFPWTSSQNWNAADFWTSENSKVHSLQE